MTEESRYWWRLAAAFPLHPLLWMLFPILALWSQNTAETPVGEATSVLLRAALIAVGTTTVFALALRSLRRGAVVAVVLLLPTMLYGYVFTDPDSRLGLVIWALVAIQLPQDVLHPLTSALNVVALTLVLLNGVPAGLGAWDRHQALAQPLIAVEPSVDPRGSLPDIWYLVPDRYSREDTLAAYEGIDDSAFVASLRDRDFQVFDRAATNYPMSMLSIAGSLNLRYLHDLDDLSGVDRALAARALIRDHELGRLTTSAGYEYLHLGSWADFSASSARAHQVLTSESTFAFDIEAARLTVAPALQSILFGEVGTGTNPTQRRLQRSHGEHQVRVLRQLAAANPDHPQFVFAHLILPHGPYVFDEDGSVMDDSQFTASNRWDGLRRQMAFTSDFLLDLIDVLQARDEPPVIVIQADEGELPRGVFDTADLSWGGFTDDQHRMHNAIFSSVYLPGGRLSVAEDEPVTAVNVLRGAIEWALGVDLPRLDDISYAFRDEHLGDYRDVSELAFSSP